MKKWSRKQWSEAELGVMVAHFIQNTLPSSITRRQIATDLNATPRQVQVWFQNCRQRSVTLARIHGISLVCMYFYCVKINVIEDDMIDYCVYLQAAKPQEFVEFAVRARMWLIQDCMRTSKTTLHAAAREIDTCLSDV